MKAFLITVIGGLIVALGSVWVTDWYNTQKAANAQQLSYDIASGYLFEPTDDWVSLWKKPGPHGMIPLQIENVGNDDLDNLTINVRSDFEPIELVTYGKQSKVNSEIPKIEREGKGFKITYQLLRKGDSGMFWVSTKYSSGMSINSPKKGMALIQKQGQYADEDYWSPIWFLVGFLALLGAFVSGMVAFESYVKTVLNTVGLDPKELQQAYEAEVAKKKK